MISLSYHDVLVSFYFVLVVRSNAQKTRLKPAKHYIMLGKGQARQATPLVDT